MSNSITKPQHIAIFCASLAGGGAERAMVNLANSFVDYGLSVDLVLVRSEGEFKSEVSSGVRVIDLKKGRVIRALPSLLRYLRAEQPQLLLSALDHVNIIAVLASLLSRISTRVVITVHAPPSVNFGQDLSLSGKIFKLASSWSYRNSSAVVGVSKGVRDDLIQNFGLEPSKVSYIYNPIIFPRLKEMGLQDINHHWFDDNKVPVIVAVGRLSVEKSYHTLIMALKIVRQKLPVRLLILGEGSERQNIQALVEAQGLVNDVELAGFVSNPYAFMKRAALYVLSSRFEGLGNVLVEALALGCHVVSTDCPTGPTEILCGGEFGKMVPVGDINAMANAFLLILEGKPSVESVLLNEHLKQFEILTVAQKYLGLFSRVISKSQI